MAGEVMGALIGFGGAVVGAGATAFVGLRQQRVDAQAERERRVDEAKRYRLERKAVADRAQEQQDKEAQVFARLLLVDLMMASTRLKRTAKSGRYWSSRFALPTDSWIRYRELVARHMKPDDWVAVSLFYRSVITAELQADAARESDEGNDRPDLSEVRERQIKVALKRLPRAQAALEDLAGTTQLTDEADGEVDASREQV